VLRRQPYIRRQWCASIIADAARRERQSEVRIRQWGMLATRAGALRVITLADGDTLHNAFRDRDFEEKPT